jgi:microcystin-dependent protein
MTNLQDFTNRSEVGTIKPWGKTTAPSGYLLCDGTAVSRTTYAELFVVLSTTYGVGDGSTTFNVPQLQGKTPQGYDGNTYNLAGTGGANTVTVAVTNNQAATNTLTNNQAVTVTGSISNTALTTAQLASHSHDINSPQDGPALAYQGPIMAAFGGALGANVPKSPAPTQNQGSGTGHNHAHTLAGTLTGTVAATTALTGTVTAAGNNTFSPYVVVNYIIKH